MTEEKVPEKTNDKEINFRALEAKHRAEMENERSRMASLQKEIEELKSHLKKSNDDDDDDPYVDQKKLEKKLDQFGKKTQVETQTQIQTAINQAIKEDRKQSWIKANSDFYEVLNHANKLYENDPELAETILEMPDGFERQKLVYKNIKALGLHKEKPKEPSVEEKINANRRSPFYQPTAESSSPYASQGDFSPQGQKQAYDHIKELQKRMRF